MGGCCAAIASDFRDVYADMLKTFELVPRTNDFSQNPKDANIGRRTRRFEGLGAPKERGKSPRLSMIDKPFECEPKQIELPTFISRTEAVWNLSAIHPYNGLLSRETVISLCFIRATTAQQESNANLEIREGDHWEIFRWDFRLWMLSMCEFYHTISLLIDSGTIPIKAGRWFQTMQNKNKNFFQLNEDGELSIEARRAIAEADELSITRKDISSKLIKALNIEMPTVFSTKFGPGSSIVPMTTDGIFNAAGEYWQQKSRGLIKYANLSERARIDYRAHMEDSKKKKETIPLIGLIEWITLRYVRSMCGREEDKNSYLPILYAWEECLPSIFAYENMDEIPGLLDLLREQKEERDRIEKEQADVGQRLDTLLDDLAFRSEVEPEEKEARQLVENEIVKIRQRAELEEEETEARAHLEEEIQKEREQIERDALLEAAEIQAREASTPSPVKQDEKAREAQDDTTNEEEEQQKFLNKIDKLDEERRNEYERIVKEEEAARQGLTAEKEAADAIQRQREGERRKSRACEITGQLVEEEEAAREALEDDERLERQKLKKIGRELKERGELKGEIVINFMAEEAEEREKIVAEEAAIREQFLVDALKSLTDAKDLEAARIKEERRALEINCKGNLDMWRRMIRRLDMIDRLLQDEEISHEEKKELMSERIQLHGNLQSLYNRLSHGNQDLTEEDCRNGLYEELELEPLFPDRKECDVTSDRAFSATLQNSDDSFISHVGSFRSFMRTYVTLLGLYGDTADEEGRNWNDGVEPLDEVVNNTVLHKACDRGDLFTDPETFEESTVDEIIASIFKRGTHECPDNINRIDFEDLVTILVENLPDHAGKYTLHPLQQLMERIGADGNEEKQKLFIQTYLRELPQSYKDEQVPSSGKFVDVAKLKLYSRFSGNPASTAVEFCSQALYCRMSDTPFSNFYKLLVKSQEEPASPTEEKPRAASVVPFTSKAVYTATAVVRCFEDTRHDEKTVMTFREWETPVSFEWFDNALSLLTHAVGLSKDALASRSLAYLRAKKVKGGFSAPTPEEEAQPDVLHRAYYLLEMVGKENGAEGARVEDVVCMSLFSVMSDEFKDDPLFKDFFHNAFSPDYILPKDRRSTKLSHFSTPGDAAQKLHELLLGSGGPGGKSDLDLYTEFFKLSLGCRAIPMSVEESVPVPVERVMNIEEFINNFTEMYAKDLEPFLLQSEANTLFHEAAAYTTLDVPFTARRYRHFLAYVCGSLITTTMFAMEYAEETDSLKDKMLLRHGVPQEFVRMLIHHGTNELGESCGEEKPEDIYKLLLERTPEQEKEKADNDDKTGEEGDAAAGVVAAPKPDLATTADWYATFWAKYQPPRPYDRWEVLAPTLPYTASRVHREDRRPLVAKINKRSIEMARKEQGNDDGCEDRYFPSSAIGACIYQTYNMQLVCEALQTSTAAHRRDAEGEKQQPGLLSMAEGEEGFTAWLEESAIPQVNRAAGRTDLGKAEMHWTGVRFVLQYIHDCMDAFFRSEEACKEVVGMIQADVGPSGRPPNLTVFMKKKAPQHCTYMDAEHVEAAREAVQKLNGPETVEQAVERALREIACTKPPNPAEAKKKQEPVTPDTVTRDTSALVDPEVVGHVIASQLIQYNVMVYFKALEAFKAGVEEKLAGVFDKALVSGSGMREAAKDMRKVASYWERLRFLLPHLHNEKQKNRRRRIYELMDRKGKGYVTVPDLHFGNAEVLFLYEFREDCLPALFRAFFAVKEQAFARNDVVYLTAGAEQIISPPEFCGYFDYFYQYLELYYMFDVLTCAGRVQNDLHIQADAPVNKMDCETQLPPMQRVDSSARKYTPIAALRAAADNPYQLTMEAIPTNKLVNARQIKLARFLLRHWGCAVMDVESFFKNMNPRCAETREMQFTEFAIWASQHNLHPEGYGHRCDDQSEELAELEERLLRLNARRGGEDGAERDDEDEDLVLEI